MSNRVTADRNIVKYDFIDYLVQLLYKKIKINALKGKFITIVIMNEIIMSITR